MNYVQFHIGDWTAGTRFLTPLEKGIYIDLLMLYYSKESPIVRTYFDRITRGYTDEERKAFDYVIETFFEEREDGFHQRRCDEEIAACHEKSEKAKKAINARWAKARKGVEPPTAEYPEATDAVRTNNERSTGEVLTNNQEPITNNTPSECAAQPRGGRVTLHPFPATLPEDWANDAATVRPDVSPEAVFLKLKERCSSPVDRKTMPMWKRMFMKWIAGEYMRTPSGKHEETEEERQRSLENIDRFGAALSERMKELGR